MAGNSWQQPVAGEPSLGTLHWLSAAAGYSVNAGTANTWTDVDVSSKVPAGTKAVLLNCMVRYLGSGVNQYGYIELRKNGSSFARPDVVQVGSQMDMAAGGENAWVAGQAVVEVDASRIFEYEIYTSATTRNAYITVLGYYV